MDDPPRKTECSRMSGARMPAPLALVRLVRAAAVAECAILFVLFFVLCCAVCVGNSDHYFQVCLSTICRQIANEMSCGEVTGG